ncbi:hypothetical protein CRUP_000542 [Coryphaenoides rupestris]|nr:hypothetical protein CRUP_000542 [Coryphaenoides rupestris]
MAKVLVFRYLYWFVLSVVFVTGATRISVFGLGYLLACFVLFLFGTQLLILACVFVVEMQKGFCWVIQLFSLVCTVKGYYDPKSVGDKTCTLPVEEAGIIWDSICFLFLLLQRRVFLSFYFLHLFRASLVKDMTFHQQAEEKSLSQLKRSMQRIRSRQKKYREEWRSSGASMDREADEPKKKSSKRWPQPWKHHAAVLHSGEYYLFESDSEGDDDTQILDILRFLWAIVLAMVDGLSEWLNLLTKQYRDTSTVLCKERYLHIHKIAQELEQSRDFYDHPEPACLKLPVLPCYSPAGRQTQSFVCIVIIVLK